MKTNIYRLVPGKSMPGHEAGDLLYKLHDADAYQWEKRPFYHVETVQVEKHPDFFEPFIHNWQPGESIFFITAHYTVTEQLFEFARHTSLAYAGNAYKQRSHAEEALRRIRLALHTDTLLLPADDAEMLKYYAQNGEREKILKLLNSK